MQTVCSENRQNLMRLFFISEHHCALIGVCVCAISLLLHIVIARVNLRIYSLYVWLAYILARRRGKHQLMMFSLVATRAQIWTNFFFLLCFWGIFSSWYYDHRKRWLHMKTKQLWLKQDCSAAALPALWGCTLVQLCFKLNAKFRHATILIVETLIC